MVVDVGGGTGQSAEEIFKFAQLKNPVRCVEPSAEMLQKAKERKGVVPVLKTAEEFFNDTSLQRCFDRVLFKYCVHHLSDPRPVFKDVERSLRPNGLFMVWSLRSISCFKPFAEVTGIDTEYTTAEEIQEYSRMLEEANFDVESSLVEIKCSLKKSKFYAMLRGRFMSTLYKLRKEKIETGIDALERGELGLIKDNEEIENYVTNVVIKAKKSALNDYTECA